MDFKIGDRVHDVSAPWRGGIVRKVLKTRIHVEFVSGLMPTEEYLRYTIYDKAHQKFLRKEK
jgi:hypothetical protein